jgi:hypothetical protein
MKKVLLAILTFASFAVTAQTSNDFSTHKQAFIEHLTKHSTAIEKAKSCVTAATNQDQLKACREAFHNDNKAIMEANKEQRRHNIDDKIQKLEAEKAKLNK